ncbi:MAG: hypothetical protein K5912_00050 [Alphaproteobacteria bacterium]|nr:hypothetical protein [Alphaproteobacteria bacterium]
MKQIFFAFCGLCLCLVDAHAGRTAPQITPKQEIPSTVKDLNFWAAMQAKNAPAANNSRRQNAVANTANVADTAQVVEQDTAQAAPAATVLLATSVNKPDSRETANANRVTIVSSQVIPASVAVVTDDVRPADREDNEDLTNLENELKERKIYRDFLQTEIAKIDSQMTECESTKGKWKAATIAGSIGVAATGIAAVAQVLNHKKAENENSDGKK